MDAARLLERASPEQREALEQVAQQARALGVRAFVAGGAVRDAVMARSVTDVDFVIEGDAIAFARTLAAARGGELTEHPRFRTATWTIGGHHHDLASTRVERYRHPGALPEVTTGVTIDDDLPRRDFTLNAMAVRIDAPGLVDPFDGVGDIERRRVRALHARSFIDDPTRILRASRYAVRYRFDIDEGTAGWLAEGVPHIAVVSGERLKYELERIFAELAEDALVMAEGWGVFERLRVPVPDASSLRRRFERMREGLSSREFPLEGLGLEPAEIVNLAGWGALVYNEGGFAISRWIDRVQYATVIRDALVDSGPLSTLSARALRGARPSEASSLLRAFGGPGLLMGWLYDSDPVKRRAALAEWKDWRWVRPVTTGEDLRAHGLPPGPEYSRLLGRLREAWLDGEIHSPDEERALLETLLTAPA